MAQFNKKLLQLNHARRALTRAENMVDLANKYDSNIQGAMNTLVTHLPKPLKRPILQKIRIKNIAGKWIEIDRYRHWRFINLNRVARIFRQVSQLLNQKSRAISKNL